MTQHRGSLRQGRRRLRAQERSEPCSPDDRVRDSIEPAGSYAGRRLTACHHEAGHALARWFFGHSTDRVGVLTVEDVRAGRWATSLRGAEMTGLEGFTEGPGVWRTPQDYIHRPSDCHLSPVTGREQALIVCIAGIAAEAAHQRKGFAACWARGGASDMAAGRQILDSWGVLRPADRQAAAHLARQRATAIVRSAPGSAAIRSVAEALMDIGTLTGAEVDRQCTAAYGRPQSDPGVWDRCWPPTLADLRVA